MLTATHNIPGIGLANRPKAIQNGKAYGYLHHIAKGGDGPTFGKGNEWRSWAFRWRTDHRYWTLAYCQSLASRELERVGFESDAILTREKMDYFYKLFVDNYERIKRDAVYHETG